MMLLRWCRQLRGGAALRRAGLAFALTGPVTGAGCTRNFVVSDAGPQAYYQTAYPLHDTSRELGRVADSIKRIGVTSYYTTYRFTREDGVRAAAVRDPATLARARERFATDHSKAGTGVIIAAGNAGLTMLTNDHVTRTPDTLIVHFTDGPEGRPGDIVESVSIRTGQRNFVLGIGDPLPFRVVARDTIRDLAALRVDLPGADRHRDVRVLRTPLGDASRLSWGSFVYVLGYPRGFRMVTRGIVSDPGYAADDGFLLDGLFNRGISGGIILGVRGDTGALEWVGMASSASASAEYMLMPERRDLQEEGVLVPYEGRLYLERTMRIEYGITFSVSSTAINRFLQESGVGYVGR